MTKKKTRQKKSSYNNTGIKHWWASDTALDNVKDFIWRASRRWNEDDIEELCNKLLQWSNHQNSLFLEDFINDIGMPGSTYRTLRLKYPLLRQVDNVVKERIGSRQRYLALMGRIDAGMTKAVLHLYLDDWKKSNLKKEEWAREDNQRIQDKEHQEKMIKLRAKEAEGAMGELLKYFEGKEVELPELNKKERVEQDNSSAKNK